MDDEFIIKELLKKGIIREEDVPRILEGKPENEDIFVTLVRKNILSEKQVIHLFKEIARKQKELEEFSSDKDGKQEDADFIVEDGIIKYFGTKSYYIIPIKSINFIEVKDDGRLIIHFPGIDRLTISFENKQDMAYLLDRIRRYLSLEDEGY